MMSQDVSHQKYHFLKDLEAFLTNISFCRASHVMESNEFRSNFGPHFLVGSS